VETLADQRLTVPTDKGANAGLKGGALVAGMAAGADSLDDMALLRHGAMKKLFDGCYAPSTLGQFLRKFTFGHVRQLDAVASRFLAGLAAQTPLTERHLGLCAARRGRHDRRAARLCQAGLGLRLLRRPWTERAARHRQHRHGGAGHRGPAAPQGLLRVARAASGWSPTPSPCCVGSASMQRTAPRRR
jgi:hypothetical protein